MASSATTSQGRRARNLHDGRKVRIIMHQPRVGRHTAAKLQSSPPESPASLFEITNFPVIAKSETSTYIPPAPRCTIWLDDETSYCCADSYPIRACLEPLHRQRLTRGLPISQGSDRTLKVPRRRTSSVSTARLPIARIRN